MTDYFTFMPPNMRLKQTADEGLTLIAAKPIRKHTSLGAIRIHFLPEFEPAAGERYYRTAGWAELANENTVNPNCETVKMESDNPTIDYIVYVATLRDIKPGEPISWRYTLAEYEGAPWRAHNLRKPQGPSRSR